MKTASEILSEKKKSIQGNLSMIYWHNTIIEAMEEYANQRVEISEHNLNVGEEMIEKLNERIDELEYKLTKLLALENGQL